MQQNAAQGFIVARRCKLLVETFVGHFSNKLSELLQDRTQQPVADISGLARGTISLYSSGARNISMAALEKLLAAFPDPAEKFALVRAFLLDQVPASQFEAVSIEPREQYLLQEPAAEYLTTDKELSAALTQLERIAKRNGDLRRVLLDLARIVS